MSLSHRRNLNPTFHIILSFFPSQFLEFPIFSHFKQFGCYPKTFLESVTKKIWLAQKNWYGPNRYYKFLRHEIWSKIQSKIRSENIQSKNIRSEISGPKYPVRNPVQSPKYPVQNPVQKSGPKISGPKISGPKYPVRNIRSENIRSEIRLDIIVKEKKTRKKKGGKRRKKDSFFSS